MTDHVAGVSPAVSDGSPAKTPVRANYPDAMRAVDKVTTEHAKPKVESAKVSQLKQPLTTEELAEMLRRINLTFDLFEIAAKYAIDESDGHVQVTVFNTRTGEVIRRIPPTDFQSSFNSFREGLGLLVNQSF
jgi:uncharacterized FlaG/YvyC family protein